MGNTRLCVVIMAWALVACSNGGTPDGGTSDTGTNPLDSTTPTDGGFTDTGTRDVPATDTGTPDTGTPDAGPPTVGWSLYTTGAPASPVRRGLALACTAVVGTGSGQIQITQTTNGGLNNGDVICIREGMYNGGSITNISLGTTGAPVTIQNMGMVRFTGGLSISNVQNVVLSGSGGAAGTMNANGISFTTTQNAITVTGRAEELTVRNIDFVNVGRMGLEFYDASAANDGSDNPRYTDVVITDLTMRDNSFHNIGFATYMNLGSPTTATRDHAHANISSRVEIAYCDFQGGRPGMTIYASNVFHANFHHNRFQGINLGNTAHEELIFLIGDGAVHHNYASNYYGMFTRAYPISLDTPGTLDMSDNIMTDGQKYSAFEVNPQPPDLASGTRFKQPNTTIYGNRTGKLGTVQVTHSMCDNYQSVLVDDYINPSTFQGTLDVRNNLVYNVLCKSARQNLPGAPADIMYIISQWQNHTATYGNNLYFATHTLAGLSDEVSGIPTASSTVFGMGGALPADPTDFFGRPHSATAPAVGAVESAP